MRTSEDGFTQEAPVLSNQFTSDLALINLLQNLLPQEVYSDISLHLQQIGQDAIGKLELWSKHAESQEPELVQYDPWGKRVDQIKMSEGWSAIEAYAAENGLIAAGYERKQGEWSRVYQMAMLYLFHPSSAFVSCPLAMTDGAAKLIEIYGDHSLKQRAFVHLTNRDPQNAWTSGQWMTEKIGGSDVSRTETRAHKLASVAQFSEENLAVKSKFDYQLSGIKFFTSATTSEMAMTLARIEGAEAGNRGLSLFYLETGLHEKQLNNIEVIRLKDKLGTRAMPTAELELKQTPACLVGGEGSGIKKIATLFNITRIYNAVCSVAQMRRAIALATDYASKREAFGKKINDHALFKESFSDSVVEFEGCLHLIFKIAHLLGREEVGKASSDEISLLRLLTPIAKLYTGKVSHQVVSEMIEVFAGVGYCEDSGLPKLLRDAHVFSIWEGTTNVLSLDVLRALNKDCPIEVVIRDLQSLISKDSQDSGTQMLIEQIAELQKFAQDLQTAKEVELATASAGQLAWFIARVYVGGLLLNFATQTASPRAFEVAKRWIEKTKRPLRIDSPRRQGTDLILR